MHWLSSPTVRWDRGFFRKLLVVCLPIVIQNLMSASLHIIDGVMIGQLGDAPYAAVTQATRYVFVYQLFLFGLASGCGIFFSQHWGTQDVKSMRRAMGLCFRGALVLAVLFGGLGLLFPQGVMSIFLPKGESFGYAIQYLTIVAAGFLITAVDTVYATCMKSAGKTVIPMTAGICSILTNTFLNWILIYGNLGAPALGVRGAAIATVIAAGVSLAINVGCSYGMKLPSAFRWQDWKLPDRAYLTQFAKTVLPVVLNEGFWSMGTSIYSVFYGRLGDAAVAAVGIVNTVDQLIFTMIYGIMNATAILVGNHLGAGDKEGARLTARRLIFACGGGRGDGLHPAGREGPAGERVQRFPGGQAAGEHHPVHWRVHHLGAGHQQHQRGGHPPGRGRHGIQHAAGYGGPLGGGRAPGGYRCPGAALAGIPVLFMHGDGGGHQNAGWPAPLPQR